MSYIERIKQIIEKIRKHERRLPKMRLSKKGLESLKSHEGLRLFAYDDKQPRAIITSSAQLIGKLTIGYGHTGKDVYIGQSISVEKAEELLRKDVEKFEERVAMEMEGFSINQNQFDALVLHTYNTGGSETLFKLVREGNKEEIINWWVTTYIASGGIYMRGLEKRRKDEAKLFYS